MTKAFAYLRVSGKGQIDGDGFPRQLAAVRAYAKAHDIGIMRVFREEGVTGSKETMDRPAWAELMTAMHGSAVHMVIIERLDRLARNLMIQEATIADDLQKHGFALVSTQEPDLQAADPARIAFRQMMGVFAEFEKRQIVLKLRSARTRQKAQTGRCEGRKPFGDREGEQAAIDRMRALAATGMKIRAIAAKLNLEGIPTRAGRVWRDAVVGRILKTTGGQA
jgi:site-specific DNA recombinase